MTEFYAKAVSLSWWARFWKTPLADLVRGQLTGSLDLRVAIAEAGLPLCLADLTRKVARHTRLSSREQVDVARELAQHFHDGLASGSAAEQLTESFGDERQAARLIRRAKLRSRPLRWRLWRRTWQTLAGVVALMVAVYLVLAVQLFAYHPTLARNYQLDIVRPTQGMPEADRAWPFYRRALLALTPVPEVAEPVPSLPNQAAAEPPVEPKLVPLVVSDEHPGSKNWSLVERWLDENRPAIEAAREGGARPSFGFVYNDTADLPWFESIHYDPKAMDPNENRQLDAVTLEHVAETRRLSWLLDLDGLRALAQEDRGAFVADVQAMLGMAEQLWGDLDFAVCKLYSFVPLRLAFDLVDRALTEHPDLLSEDDLRKLAHSSAAFAGGDRIEPSLAGERLMIEDSLQWIYSDNGRGDGVLTADGFKLLLDRAGFLPLERINSDQAFLRDPKVWPALALLVPSRRQMSQMATERYERFERGFNRPLWLWTRSDVLAEKNRLWLTPISRIFDSTLLGTHLVPTTFLASEIVTQQRDATLVALALMLYHRQHGVWPQQLTDLVPELLPAVPLDRYSGQPLRYRLADDRPLVYSVGPDRTDSNGQPVSNPHQWMDPSFKEPKEAVGSPPPSGDWILWPLPADAPPAG
jgi:hypothetical protein